MTEKTEVAKVEPKPPPAVTMGERGVVLASLDEAWRFATAVVQSGLAPKGMQTPQAVLIAIQMGAELGLPPMASLQNIAVINGRPSVWGDAMLAVCRSSGLFDESQFDEHVEESKAGLVATCTVRRLPNGKPIVRTFGMKDAERAGLSGKSGPWTQYPRRMLQLRARSWALRDAFADLLRGCLTAEEVRDIPRDPVAAHVDQAKQLRQEVEDVMAAPQLAAAANRRLVSTYVDDLDDATSNERVAELLAKIDAEGLRDARLDEAMKRVESRVLD